MDKIEIREINGYRFAKAGHILLDTPPKGFAAEWYEAGREADTLLICSPDPFPESVRIFRQMRPKASIIAPYYTAWRLKEILGEDLNIQAVRCDLKLDGLKLSAVSQAGKGSFLAASDDNGVFWSGDAFTRKIEAVRYEKPTVVIACTTGCDFTGQMAEMIASGIRDSGMTDAVILDLCSEKTDDVIGACANAQGLLIGTSSSDGDAPECVWKLLTSMNRGIFSGKICGVFSSCGSDDSAAANVADRLRQLDMTFQEPAFSVQYVPDETAQNSIYEYGYDFGCRVQNVPNTHRLSLVKCLVCGEIFDASLGVCPVCGVGMDKCIPVEDEIIGHKEDTERTYLCVGGGIASLSAAEAIRKRDKTGKIIMLSAEDTPPVNRPMLTKNMAVSARVDGSIDVKEASWFSDNNIELRLNTRVCEIEPALKKVVLEDGTDISYDRLIYAAGAECFIPPIEDRKSTRLNSWT